MIGFIIWLFIGILGTIYAVNSQFKNKKNFSLGDVCMFGLCSVSGPIIFFVAILMFITDIAEAIGGSEKKFKNPFYKGSDEKERRRNSYSFR